jgi:hypothetical protein
MSMKSIETILDRRVENRHGEASKQKVGKDFEPVTVKSVKIRESRVVTGCSVGVFARFPD